MSVTSPVFIVMAVSALFFAGFVKGTVGFGITLIVVPILAMAITPQEAIVLVSLPVFVMTKRSRPSSITKARRSPMNSRTASAAQPPSSP